MNEAHLEPARGFRGTHMVLASTREKRGMVMDNETIDLLKSVQANLLRLKYELHKDRTLQADELATFAITDLNKALRELCIVPNRNAPCSTSTDSK